MTVREFPTIDGKECAILRVVRNALGEARATGLETPKEKASFIEKRLRSFEKTEFNLAASLLAGIMEESDRCDKCGRVGGVK